MSTSPSPTFQLAFFQRRPTQVQAIKWPDSVDDAFIAAAFDWVNSSGGRMVWRMSTPEDPTEDPFPYPVIVGADGDIPVNPGDHIVRMPSDRFIVELDADFQQDYQGQARELKGGQRDFLAEIDKIAKAAEASEAAMTPAERREASNVEMQRLGDVAKGGA